MLRGFTWRYRSLRRDDTGRIESAKIAWGMVRHHRTKGLDFAWSWWAVITLVGALLTHGRAVFRASLRRGMLARVYDSAVVVCAASPSAPIGARERGAHVARLFTLVVDADGYAGTYCPRLTLHVRRVSATKTDCVGRPYIATHTIRVPLPHVPWGAAYRMRRLGGIAVYKLTARVWYRIGRAPRSV